LLAKLVGLVAKLPKHLPELIDLTLRALCRQAGRHQVGSVIKPSPNYM